MWQKAPELEKLTFDEADGPGREVPAGAGHATGAMPTIKELYSLIDFNGNCRRGRRVPYLDTRYFDFRYGDEAKGERHHRLPGLVEHGVRRHDDERQCPRSSASTSPTGGSRATRRSTAARDGRGDTSFTSATSAATRTTARTTSSTTATAPSPTGPRA